MAVNIVTIRDALKTALKSDAALIDWSSKWFDRPDGLAVIDDPQGGPLIDEEKPAAVIGRASIYVEDELKIGALQTQRVSSLTFTIVWMEEDPTRANDEHSELHDILCQFVMRNPQLGGASCFLIRGEAGETQQPDQSYIAALRIDYGLLKG